ncbi:hypothetical protein PHLCEN_2v6761 [Hermanssonia centrifuga]|uniref:Uncharacterized protein n=1 Tax=Hermanssonia centrifuga TaxID=98765 RepID=A0A2R6NYI8_9APHY|nr:hypothetical protein PHLCEN_2v6761 [Hermanssonia centrifuga]
MKSCLKRSTSAPEVLYQARPGVSGDAQSKEQNRKSVSFSEDGEEEVFYAEDWDRSPAAVTQRLTYRDVYELKELRMALPRINLTNEHRLRNAAPISKCV